MLPIVLKHRLQAHEIHLEGGLNRKLPRLDMTVKVLRPLRREDLQLGRRLALTVVSLPTGKIPRPSELPTIDLNLDSPVCRPSVPEPCLSLTFDIILSLSIHFS